MACSSSPGGAILVGTAWNWSWLAAVGIAPLLLAFLPCAAMCALGLCVSKISGGSCSADEAAAADPNQLMLDLGRSSSKEKHA